MGRNSLAEFASDAADATDFLSIAESFAVAFRSADVALLVTMMRREQDSPDYGARENKTTVSNADERRIFHAKRLAVELCKAAGEAEVHFRTTTDTPQEAEAFASLAKALSLLADDIRETYQAAYGKGG